MAMSEDITFERAERFRSRIVRRNLTEYAAAAVVIIAFGAMAFVVEPALAKLGAWLIVAGAIAVCWSLRAQARAVTREELIRAQSGGSPDFYRDELVRQRNALRRVWLWYLGPLIPGLVLFLVGVGVSPSSDFPPIAGLLLTVVGLAFTAAAFLFIGWANAKAADVLQAEIDSLDAAR